MKTIKQLKLTGKRVFIRVDFNVPLKETTRGTKITDDLRIQNALPTLRYILKQKPKQIILGTHLGRPKPGSTKGILPYSLAPVAAHLSKLLKKSVYFHANPLAPIESSNKLVLLENLRFYDGEKKGSLSFAKALAQHADVYVNDAFGTAHRKDASVYTLTKQFKQKGIGLLMEKELENVHLNHKKPIVAIFGAAKIKDKLPILTQLLKKVDKVLLGGGVVFTFLKAMDIEVGKSLVEDDMILQARKLLEKFGSKLVFPTDFVATSPARLKKWSTFSAAEKKEALSVVEFDGIKKSLACYDIGPRSVKLFSAVLERSKTVIWNGPVGMFEVKPFDKGTNKIAKYIASSKMTSIVGGGDTASAIRKTKLSDSFSHISTGGGASLELLSGKKLPAVEVLKA